MRRWSDEMIEAMKRSRWSHLSYNPLNAPNPVPLSSFGVFPSFSVPSCQHHRIIEFDEHEVPPHRIRPPMTFEHCALWCATHPRC